MRFIHAFLLCHFTYVAAMHKWKPLEKKLDTQIRKITKKVLGVPMCTSNDWLVQPGIHNTLDEIAEAQERAQVVRLSTTSAGHQILRVRCSPGEDFAASRRYTLEGPSAVSSEAYPRDMHPERNVGRR